MYHSLDKTTLIISVLLKGNSTLPDAIAAPRKEYGSNLTCS
jgi:hypothetical protein